MESKEQILLDECNGNLDNMCEGSVLIAMDEYSNQQNTALIDSNRKLREALEYAKRFLKPEDADIVFIEQTLKETKP